MAVNIAGQTITGNSAVSDAPKTKYGHIVYDATAITATDVTVVFVGFTPQYFLWENETDRVKGEWKFGMAADSCIKTVAAGTRTLEVTGGNHGITVCDSDGTANTSGRYVSISQNATLALILASKTCGWMAQA
jgi:hypothetical protein